MRTGAVITAAGMSSRMGDFKPLLNIGSMTIVNRIVSTLRQASAEKIVMVTGYNVETLEHHLAGSGIVFLRNPDYEHTHMFDSAKIGLAYLADKCDRILFTPVDDEGILHDADTPQDYKKLLEFHNKKLTHQGRKRPAPPFHTVRVMAPGRGG